MGQYHYPANLDKKEYLHAHKFGDGLKLLEIGLSDVGTTTGLTLLLAASNGPYGRGGGDWHPWVDGVGYFNSETYGEERTLDKSKAYATWLAKEVPGRWAGDRIALIGDYAEDDDFPGFKANDPDMNPWAAKDEWTDISHLVIAALALDYYTRGELRVRGLDEIEAEVERQIHALGRV